MWLQTCVIISNILFERRKSWASSHYLCSARTQCIIDFAISSVLADSSALRCISGSLVGSAHLDTCVYNFCETLYINELTRCYSKLKRLLIPIAYAPDSDNDTTATHWPPRIQAGILNPGIAVFCAFRQARFRTHPDSAYEFAGPIAEVVRRASCVESRASRPTGCRKTIPRLQGVSQCLMWAHFRTGERVHGGKHCNTTARVVLPILPEDWDLKRYGKTGKTLLSWQNRIRKAEG